MEVSLRYFFTRNEIGQAVATATYNHLIGGVARYVTTRDGPYSLGVILAFMSGKTSKLPDGSLSNIYLRCEEFIATGETKIVRVAFSHISNNKPQPTDIGYEFVQINASSKEWMYMIYVNRIVNEWMKEIEKAYEFCDDDSTVDLGSPYSSYSGD